MVTRSRWVLVAAALVLSACQPNRFVSGWVPYWGGSNGRAVIGEPGVSSLMSELSPLWHQTDDDGTVDTYGNTSGLASTVASMRAQGLPVIPAIFDSQAAGVMSGIIADPVKRTSHVQHIVKLVTSYGYDGIDLDYEVFAFNEKSQWTSITPNWVAFVEELADALHSRGKLLSVTVPPVWDFSPGDGMLSGYTVYAQAQIAPFVDRLRLMVYDWSISSPGPIAPMFWVNAAIAYSSAVVPTSKLQLGVPTYGRHWLTKANTTEVCPDGALTSGSVLMRNAAELAAEHNVVPTRHKDGELTFGWTETVTGPRDGPAPPPTWTPPRTVVTFVNTPARGTPLQPAIRLTPPTAQVTCTVQHTVFVPDAVSVRARAEAALAAEWSGIALFAIGYESLDVYQSLAEVAPLRAGGDPFGVVTELEVSGRTVRLVGHAVNPEFDLPVPVRFTFSSGGAPVGATIVLARTEVAGMPTGTGPFHGFDQLVPLAPGSYTVCTDQLRWGGGVAAAMGCQQFIIGT